MIISWEYCVRASNLAEFPSRFYNYIENIVTNSLRIDRETNWDAIEASVPNVSEIESL